MTNVPPVIDFPRWVVENEENLLRQPTNNKQPWSPIKDFIVMAVGGPNVRTDFHINPYEEWFFQYRGNMHVDIMTDDGKQTIEIPEGSMWVAPGNVPHSPQRPERDSVGIVLERVREEGVLESFCWYCPICGRMLHNSPLQLRNIEKDVVPIFDKFYADTAARTCGECGAVHPGRP